MPGLIIDGREEQVPGLKIINYKDDSKLKLVPGHSMRARYTRWIQCVGLHNTKNIQTSVVAGVGPSRNIGEAVVHFWSTSPTPAGAHLIVDWDAMVYCLADLLQDAAYHMSAMNEVSIGIEIYEDSNGMVYEEQLKVVVALVKWLCQRFRIQMQMPIWNDNSEIPRIRSGGKDCVGVFGHCHNNFKDKAHDPGFDIMRLLRDAGFRQFNFHPHAGLSPVDMFDDKSYWAGIQHKLGIGKDGVPGPKTCDALQALGFANGIYDFATPV